MRYTILELTSVTELATEVEKLIADGWKPQGGVSAMCYIQHHYDATPDSYTYYSQAMIKE